MNKKELIGSVGGLILLVSACFGTYSWLDARFAHAGDISKVRSLMEALSMRLDRKILEDRLQDTQKKIWTIEDRYCTDKSKPCSEDKMPQTVMEQYRELKLEKSKIQEELDELKRKKK